MRKQGILAIFLIGTISILLSRETIVNINPDFKKYIIKDKRKLVQAREGNGYIPPVRKVPYKDFSDLKKLSGDLPEHYQSPASKIKNQNPRGTCWAFATLGAIESKWLREEGEEKDLSEDNMLNGHEFEDLYEGEGGNSRMATAYLSHGKGPILEEDDPYTADSTTPYIDLPPVYWVSEARYFPSQSQYSEENLDEYIKQLKSVIKNESPVYSGFYINLDQDKGYYDRETFTYFCPDDSVPNHAVTLVGWNDTISTQADKDGAWIAKNSYGKKVGDDGYLYISYYDSTINSEVTYWPDTSRYSQDNFIKGRDTLGFMGGLYMRKGVEIGHTLMKVSLSGQTITKVGTFAPYESKLQVTIYDNFDGDSPQDVITTGSRSAPYSGFYTLDLESPVYKEQDKVYIDIEYDFSNSTVDTNYIPIESALTDPETGDTLADPHISEGYYWIAFGDSPFIWNSAERISEQFAEQGQEFEFDGCIKVYGQKGDGTGIVSDRSSADEFKLGNNYPNPFNPVTNIDFTIPAKQKVILNLYNIRGQKVKTIANQHYPAGKHTVKLEGTGLSSGVYFYKMEIGNQEKIKKCVLLK